GGPGTFFGAALGGFGSDILVGAPGNGGGVYLFDGAPGALLRTFADPSPHPQDPVGFALPAQGNYVLIGDPHDDAARTGAGAVCVFDGPRSALVRPIHSPEPQDFANFGFPLVGLGPESFAVGGPSLLLTGDGGGVFLFALDLPVGNPRSGPATPGTIRGT